MIKHILQMIKTQRTGNGWLFAELGVVFILLWYLADFFLMTAITYMQPTGHDIDNVYRATLALRPANSPSFIAYEAGSEEPGRNLLRIVDRLRTNPDVEAACLSRYALPYTYSNNTNSYKNDTLRIECHIRSVTPDYFRVFGIHAADGGQPVVLAEALTHGTLFSTTVANHLYGIDNARGRSFTTGGNPDPSRVEAVTVPLKKSDFDQPVPTVFTQLSISHLMEENENELCSAEICFRVRPGVTTTDYAARFKRDMQQQLAVGNYWLADVESYVDIRSRFMQNTFEASGLKIDLCMALFFLVNVFLAIIGLFWFRVNRRRGEIGLRMSVGSTRRGVRNLMIGEGLVLLTLVSMPALFVCANLTWAGLLSETVMPVSPMRFLLVSAMTWLALASVILLAIWYPARRASRMEPAEALHYE